MGGGVWFCESVVLIEDFRQLKVSKLSKVSKISKISKGAVTKRKLSYSPFLVSINQAKKYGKNYEKICGIIGLSCFNTTNRCFLRTREDVDFQLEALGLSEYSPYNIVRKTNGVLFEDTYWIRWADMPDLVWDDVDSRG